MFDSAITPVLHRIYVSPAVALHRWGVTADTVSISGFVVGALAVPALAAGWYTLALLLILLNRIGDGIDGAIARITSPTDRGAFLDIALDFVFYALVPFGFALADPSANALAAAALIAAFVGTGSSFLAFASVEGRRGRVSSRFPRKGIHYLSGLTEGAETIAVLSLMCLFPAWFPALAWGFAGLCGLDTVLRWRAGWVAFGDD